MPVGKNNRYGRPNEEVLNNLDNSKIFRTEQDGSIMFNIKKKNLEYCDIIIIGCDNTTLPKIVFKEMTLQENIDVIKWAYFENNGALSVHDFTIKYFPQLANLDPDFSIDDIYNVIEEVVTNDYNKYKDRIESETERYNTLWKQYNDNYFKALSSYLNIEWPNDLKMINATVGLIPVFPRYLDNFTFSIGTGVDDSKLLEVCAHETLHFLWFEKWKQIHPETPRREYDSPYLVWQYSEMVTDPILNNKPFSTMFDFNERGYDSFYELKDGSSKVMDNLRNIYSKDISIEEKIDNGFNYISRVLNEDEKVTKM